MGDEERVEGTRDRLVMAALELFARQGYEATGLKEVLSQAKANSGSLYYFFKSKEDLLLAVLDKYVELLDAVIMRPAFERTDDPVERIFAVLEGYREFLVTSNCTAACPIGMLALEVGGSNAGRSAGVLAKIAENFSNWCKAIEGCLDAVADRLPAELDRKALSRFVLTVMEGGMMQARAHRSVEHYDLSVAQLRDYMNRLLASS